MPAGAARTWRPDWCLLLAGRLSSSVRGPLPGLLESPHDLVAGLPRSKRSKRSRQEPQCPLWANSRSQIASLPPYSFVTQTSPHSWWKETVTGRRRTRKWGSLGPRWRLATSQSQPESPRGGEINSPSRRETWQDFVAIFNPPESGWRDLAEDQSEGTLCSQSFQSRRPHRKVVAENECVSHLHYIDGKPEA